VSTACSFFGVTCENGHVISINLVNNQLEGTLPPSLVDLTYLRELVSLQYSYISINIVYIYIYSLNWFYF
jgi:hypothetical protein